MIECFVVRPMNMRISERVRIIEHLTKPGSDFQRALCDDQAAGMIALVCRRAEIVGWARTEYWSGYQTLEAFTALEHRGQGIALFGAAGLKAAGAFDSQPRVAVFAASMERLARCVNLAPILYRREEGAWVLA